MTRYAGTVLAAALVATTAAAGVDDLGIQSRVAEDGLTVEFVVSNPDPVTYRCSSIHVDTLYGGGSGIPPVGPLFSTVEDVVIAAQQIGQVFRQNDADVAALRTQFPLIESVSSLGQISQFCSADSERFVGALILDDQSGCGDDRTLSKIYSVNTQTGRLSAMAPPAVWQFESARVWSSQSLPIAYALYAKGQQPVLHALALTQGALAPRGQLFLPEAPRMTDANGLSQSVDLAGAAFVGSWLALVYSPFPSQAARASNVVIDLISLDSETGTPGAAERITLTAAPFAGIASELFVATTIAGELSLFLVPVPVYPNNIIGGVPILSETPVDEFEDLHGRLFTTAKTALRIDVFQDDDGPPAFAIPPNDGPVPFPDWTATFNDAMALKAGRLPEPSAHTRIANYALALAPGKGLRDLQLLVLQNDGSLPVLSDRDAGFCDARVLAVVPRADGMGAADVNATDASGRSLLHYAATRGNLSKVAVLIARGADVSLVDNEGFTPVMRTVAGNHGAVLDLLLSEGADTARDVPSPFGPPTSFAFFLVSQACDTCLEPLEKAGISLDPLETPQGRLSLEQTVCSQAMFGRAMLSRRFPSDEMLQNMPANLREKLKAEREAYLALDTKEDRLDRMISALGLSCPAR
ncbi:ankyrin repeat domain-containing protein [Roseivivax sp. GX 12232]|uniref:ankyrin repeat domain-containing protein n=1 Tax=Roseivivax sp. GX 12232 TaxID=2900547 RepID=UPI001E2C4134|nr:ankyrin repeat domain-containing protein [Roseivivax sp. GX 12232]MCE0504125.1 ankyrin repeat domain-containing protein [Roseivivax sp. GX 12232]